MGRDTSKMEGEQLFGYFEEFWAGWWIVLVPQLAGVAAIVLGGIIISMIIKRK